MDLTVADVGLGVAIGGVVVAIGVAVWQVVTKRRETPKVVVDSWWEKSDPDGPMMFVVEAHNEGTLRPAQLTAVGYEPFFEGEPNELPYWWERDNTPDDQRKTVDGSTTLPVTLAPDHRAVFRLLETEVKGLDLYSIVPVVYLGSGTIARGEKVPTWPHRINFLGFDPTA